MKTLYISDLDGTLLRDDETLSQYTCSTINRLVRSGLQFSFATARSRTTAEKVTNGLECSIPMVVYNGTMVVDRLTQEILVSNFFSATQVLEVRCTLERFKVYPIVYSLQRGVEKFSYVPRLVNEHMRTFLDTRRGDVRENPTLEEEALYSGDVFYFTCIDSEERLKPVYDTLRLSYNCIYQRDYYSDRQWLEILPQGANKSNAVLQLKRLLNCDRVVSFGDGINDVEMFKVSDECYAVANAVDEVKSIATAIVGSNQHDGVARWLDCHRMA